ncbi:MAG: DUF805 domain-containing protein [Kiritimatiellae bacterium]|nr:DUF805 domain-containing protein [Kiritimatiellia bacterium]
MSSPYALKEIGFANDKAEKRVIMIRFNDDKWPDDFFFQYQYADVVDWRSPEQREKLFRDIRKWLSEADSPNYPHAGKRGKTTPPANETDGEPPANNIETCPICGKKNLETDTFQCKQCGRSGLCLTHQTPTGYRCEECAASHPPLQPIMSLPQKEGAVDFLTAWKFGWTKWSWAGRSTRAEFGWRWLSIGLELGVSLLIGFLMAGLLDEEAAVEICPIIYLVFVCIQLPGMIVRRMHDIGKSGHWAWIVVVSLIPHVWFLGLAVLLWLLCKEGDKGKNAYG